MPNAINMDIRQLNYFLTIADSGSFSRASEKLFIAQPALSRQVRLLEETLNVKLFVRHGRGVVLTAAGELLYGRSRSLLQDLECAQADVAAMAGGVTGRVTLGLVPTLGHDYIANILANYRQKFPQVSLSVKSAMSGTLQQMVARKRVDLAIIYNPSNRRNLNSQHLLDENLYLIGPANSTFANHKSVSLKKVLELPLMLPEEKHGLRIFMESEASKAGKSLQISIEVSAWPLITEMVQRGLGYTVLTYAAVHEMLGRGELTITPIVPKLTRTRALVTPAGRPTSIATYKLAELIIEQVGDHARQGLCSGRL